jgi:L-threonylcarbamoyladenylate synthase
MPVLRGDDPAALDEAAQRLVAGGLVAFATETVYGLGARADDAIAVARIFAAKGRPADHPLIVHVADIAAARRFADPFEGDAERLAAAFWPGPLTVIVRRRPGVAEAAAGGQDSIGLRCPAHPVAAALLARCAALGVWGVAAPSANRFGRVSPTRAAHVADELGPDLLVLDGGDCALGIESAIVDVSRAMPVLLRPGVLGRARIEAVLGRPLGTADADAPRAPGTLASHYAPSATLRLMDTDQLRQALALLPGGLPGLAVYSRSGGLARPGVLARRMPAEPEPAAHELFAVLREFDAAGARLIWVETPPATPDWAGVTDRLSRAAAT